MNCVSIHLIIFREIFFIFFRFLDWRELNNYYKSYFYLLSCKFMEKFSRFELTWIELLRITKWSGLKLVLEKSRCKFCKFLIFFKFSIKLWKVEVSIWLQSEKFKFRSCRLLFWKKVKSFKDIRPVDTMRVNFLRFWEFFSSKNKLSKASVVKLKQLVKSRYIFSILGTHWRRFSLRKFRVWLLKGSEPVKSSFNSLKLVRFYIF